MTDTNEYIGYEITRGNRYYRGVVKAYKWDIKSKARMHPHLRIMMPAKPYYMGSGHALDEAIAKHGVKAFEREALARFDNKQDASEWEREHVVMNDVDPLSYNINGGGKSGYKMGKKVRAKMSEDRAGEKHPSYGGGKGCFPSGKAHPNYGKFGKDHPRYGKEGKRGEKHPNYKPDAIRTPSGRISRAKAGE